MAFYTYTTCHSYLCVSHWFHKRWTSKQRFRNILRTIIYFAVNIKLRYSRSPLSNQLSVLFSYDFYLGWLSGPCRPWYGNVYTTECGSCKFGYKWPFCCSYWSKVDGAGRRVWKNSLDIYKSPRNFPSFWKIAGLIKNLLIGIIITASTVIYVEPT